MCMVPLCVSGFYNTLCHSTDNCSPIVYLSYRIHLFHLYLFICHALFLYSLHNEPCLEAAFTFQNYFIRPVCHQSDGSSTYGVWGVLCTVRRKYGSEHQILSCIAAFQTNIYLHPICMDSQS